ncbi:MAG TPA: DUF418 domain-containing protein [Vicinamibacterales bacterium]|nr:DUF418 domain-containing protein [Vicinamibacterales bacterium]
MTAVAAAATAPVLATERMATLDAVRGVAVLGILLANIFPISGLAFVPPGTHLPLPMASWHEPLFFLMLVLIEAKFYSLFSFLFGVGFAVFVQRAAARGADAARLFKRRLVGLMIIGLIHTVLIWMGDILLTYAVIGFALVPFLRKGDRKVLQWAAAMLLLPILLYGLLVPTVSVAGVTPEPSEPGALPPILAEAVAGFAAGSYADVVKGNIVFTLAQVARRFMLMFFPRVFGMFLLGFYVGRRNIFADLDAHRPLLRRVFGWGMAIGLPLSYAGAVLEGNNMGVPSIAGLVETTVKSIGAPALALGYAAGLCLLFQRARGLRAAFAPAGQMALTNYLLHSVAALVIFYGIGFGLFGRLPLAVVMGGAVLFFGVQMAASRAWLTRAAFGPAEWAWRTFTYGRRVPLLKGPV